LSGDHQGLAALEGGARWIVRFESPPPDGRKACHYLHPGSKVLWVLGFDPDLRFLRTSLALLPASNRSYILNIQPLADIELMWPQQPAPVSWRKAYADLLTKAPPQAPPLPGLSTAELVALFDRHNRDLDLRGVDPRALQSITPLKWDEALLRCKDLRRVTLPKGTHRAVAGHVIDGLGKLPDLYINQGEPFRPYLRLDWHADPPELPDRAFPENVKSWELPAKAMRC
jgi:hypothetical protein